MTYDPMLIIDDTLLLINLSEKNNRIPSRGPHGELIRHVGAGVAPSRHKSLVFEEGIETVSLCSSLEMAELPTTVRTVNGAFDKLPTRIPIIRLWRSFPLARWRSLSSQMTPASRGRMLFSGPLAALDLESDKLEINMVAWYPQDADVLFIPDYPEYIPNRDSECEFQHPCIGIRDDLEKAIPVASLVKLARNRHTVGLNASTEAAADIELRANRQPHPGTPVPNIRRTIVIANTPVSIPGSDNVLVCFTFISCYPFFCSLLPVMLEGECYYIGCTNYLFGRNNNRAYQRIEQAVFSQDGLVTDRALTEAVYEKFMLMCYV